MIFQNLQKFVLLPYVKPSSWPLV